MMGNSFTFPQFLAVTEGSNAALVTFAIYTLAVFGLAAISNRLMKSKSFLSEYFLGSRSLGVWAFALTFAATSASGGSFTGFPSKIYTHGWVLGLWIGSYVVVPICAMGLLGKRINQVARLSGAITVPDVLRDRFRSPNFGLLAVSLIVFFMSFNLVAQFKAGSEILNTLLADVGLFKSTVEWVSQARTASGIEFLQAVDPAYLLCLVAFAAAVIVYTTYGGFHAVVWTDVMQGVVMVIGVIVMLPLAIMAVGGLPAATDQMSRMTPPRLGLAEWRLEDSIDAEFAMNSPWFLLPGESEERPRLFRVNKTLTIPADDQPVRHSKYVEITTPEEIDRQLQRLTATDEDSRHIVARFNEDLGRMLDSQQSWIEAHADELSDAPQRLQRIEARRQALANNQIAALREAAWNPLRVELTFETGYAYGAGEPGHYVKGPGPLPGRLPARPGTVELTIQPADSQVRVRNNDDLVVAEKLLEGSTGALALDAGEYRLEIVRDGYVAEDVPVIVTEGEVGSVSVELTADPQTTHAAVSEDERWKPMSAGFLPLSIAISFFFMWAISGAGQPSSMVRLMAFNNSTTLRRSIFTVAFYYSAIYFPLVIIFCCARVLLPGMDLESDRIMPQMAVTLTSSVGHAWLAGLLVAAPFAAVMSTVDSFLLMISSALVRDIYQRNINPDVSEKSVKRMSYLVTFLVGAGAMLGAVNPPQFLQDIIVYVGSGLAACFLGPMVFALYWPRANSQGCIGGMLAGFGAHLAMYVAGIFVNGSFFRPVQLVGFNPIIIGLLVSFVSTYIVARTTPPPPDDLVRKYFYRRVR